MGESVLVKVIVIGDSGVGKSNLITRLCQDSFSECYTATIGVDFKLKTILHSGIRYRMQIWDTAGQERFHTLTPAYFKNANGILLLYSISEEKSFKNIGKWLTQIENAAPEQCPLVLVGAKKDLEDEREVSREEGSACASKFGADWMEASSKTGEGVVDAFEKLVARIHQGGGVREEGELLVIGSQRLVKDSCMC